MHRKMVSPMRTQGKLSSVSERERTRETQTPLTPWSWVSFLRNYERLLQAPHVCRLVWHTRKANTAACHKWNYPQKARKLFCFSCCSTEHLCFLSVNSPSVYSWALSVSGLPAGPAQTVSGAHVLIPFSGCSLCPGIRSWHLKLCRVFVSRFSLSVTKYMKLLA